MKTRNHKAMLWIFPEFRQGIIAVVSPLLLTHLSLY